VLYPQTPDEYNRSYDRIQTVMLESREGIIYPLDKNEEVIPAMGTDFETSEALLLASTESPGARVLFQATVGTAYLR